MNCKPGDLAVMIRSSAGNEGTFVHVVGSDIEGMSGSEGYPGAGWLWHCRAHRPIAGHTGFIDVEFAFPDAWLRPIRDPGDDAVDETLTWLEVTV